MFLSLPMRKKKHGMFVLSFLLFPQRFDCQVSSSTWRSMEQILLLGSGPWHLSVTEKCWGMTFLHLFALSGQPFHRHFHPWGFPWGIPKRSGWFTTENPIQMGDDWEYPILGNLHIRHIHIQSDTYIIHLGFCLNEESGWKIFNDTPALWHTRNQYWFLKATSANPSTMSWRWRKPPWEISNVNVNLSKNDIQLVCVWAAHPWKKWKSTAAQHRTYGWNPHNILNKNWNRTCKNGRPQFHSKLF